MAGFIDTVIDPVAKLTPVGKIAGSIQSGVQSGIMKTFGIDRGSAVGGILQLPSQTHRKGHISALMTPAPGSPGDPNQADKLGS